MKRPLPGFHDGFVAECGKAMAKHDRGAIVEIIAMTRPFAKVLSDEDIGRVATTRSITNAAAKIAIANASHSI